MKSNLFFLALICATIMVSCQKPGLLPALPILDTTTKPTVPQNPPDTTPPPPYFGNFGVFVNEADGLIIPQIEEAPLIHDLGGGYARLAISNRNWTNTTARNAFLDAYRSFAAQQPVIKILLNINWINPGVTEHFFPGATPDYQRYFKDVTDTLTSAGYDPPALIVVENEENNPNQHSINGHADQDPYFDMLRSDAIECHSKNLKLTNGGLTNLGIIFLVKDYFNNTRQDTAAANEFIRDCWPQTEIDFWNDHEDSAQAKLDIAKYYMDNYKNIDLDFVNMHWYEPVQCVYASNKTRLRDLDTVNINPDCLRGVYTYFDDPLITGGKPLICNEAGQVTSSTNLPLQVLCMMRRLPFVAYYSGDRPEGIRLKRPFGQYSLHTAFTTPPYYSVRATGDAFRDAVESIHADPNGFCEIYYPKGE